ncbi:MAG: Maf family protein [Nostocoides sp.]
MPVHLVLASASPARRSLLTRAGVDPTVVVSDVDEDAVLTAQREREPDLAPGEMALLLARAKAEMVAGELTAAGVDGAGDGHLVLGCDSVFELDGQVHGKPGTKDVAVTRWRAMRGRRGTLHTGHWLIDDRRYGSAGAVGASASTSVCFAQVSDSEIEDYVASGEPLTVAGAFTLEGRAAPFIEGIEGDPSNVMGLSLPLLRRLLIGLGLTVADLR